MGAVGRRVLAGACLLWGGLLVCVSAPGGSRAESVPFNRWAELARSAVHPSAMDGVNPQRNGRSAARVSQGNPRPVWREQLPFARLMTPVVSHQGQVIVAGEGGVAAYDAQGSQIFHHDVGAVMGPPALTDSGAALVVNRAGALWRVSVGEAPVRLAPHLRLAETPLVLPDARLLVIGLDAVVRLLDRDGNELTDLPVRPGRARHASVTGDGRILLVGSQPLLTVVEPLQGVVGRARLDQQPVAPPVVGDDGTVWLAGDRGELLGVAPSGRVRARHSLGAASAQAMVAVGRDGHVRLVDKRSRFLCLSSAGKVIWETPSDGRSGSITLDADDTALFTTTRGTLTAVNADGRIRFRVRAQFKLTPRPVLGPSGTIYMADVGGVLQAWR